MTPLRQYRPRSQQSEGVSGGKADEQSASGHPNQKVARASESTRASDIQIRRLREPRNPHAHQKVARAPEPTSGQRKSQHLKAKKSTSQGSLEQWASRHRVTPAEHRAQGTRQKRNIGVGVEHLMQEGQSMTHFLREDSMNIIQK